MNILVTGTAGFIGFHLAKKLVEMDNMVTGIDNINDYYDTSLKLSRLQESGIDTDNLKENEIYQSGKSKNYRFIKTDLRNARDLNDIFARFEFDAVCNLAAQAGVRYSLVNPHAYIDSNIIGFMNILEACRHNRTGHLVFASSSSVYGLNQALPFSTHDNIDHPISLYAASKKSNELTAHTYSYLFGLPCTGLRFFTVYGPWGRPDMALFIFTRNILEGTPIDIFNNGNMKRDFTYIDDIVEGIIRAISAVPSPNELWDGKKPDPSSSPAPFKIYNIGNGKPENLMEFISEIEKTLGKKAKKNFQPLQPGDVPVTWADTADLEKNLGYKPHTDIKTGIRRFIDWYKNFYGVEE